MVERIMSIQRVDNWRYRHQQSTERGKQKKSGTFKEMLAQKLVCRK